MKDYIDQAIRTASREYYGQYMESELGLGSIRSSIRSLQQLDILKKGLFYGKRLDSMYPIENGFAFSDAIACLDERETATLHGILGLATEAGELLETIESALAPCTLNGGFRKVNLFEELGDVLWYVALICHAQDFKIEDVAAANIRKLQARYPEKFNKECAINRNVEKETEALK